MRRRGSRARRLGARGFATACVVIGVLLMHSIISAAASVSYSAPRLYPTGPTGSLIGDPELFIPYSLATADVNGDGHADIVTANWNRTVSVLLGTGDGNFAPHVEYATAGTAFMVAIADLNGDGKPDLVVGNGDMQAVSLLLGNGDGTFRPHADIASGIAAYAVEVGDFNNDHRPDLVVTSVATGSVSILLGNGDGTFQASVDSSLGTSGSAYGDFAVGDFDGDGNLDIVIASLNAPSLSVLLGKGNGTFQPPRAITLPQPARPQIVTRCDLDGDGTTDLIVASSYLTDGAIRVLFGNGDGTFRAPVVYQTDTYAVSYAVLDANADGKPDIAVASGDHIAILTNTGGGALALANSLSVGGFLAGITTLDANGDGKPDLAVQGVNVLLNTTPLNTAPITRLQSLPVVGSPAPAPHYRPNSGAAVIPPARLSNGPSGSAAGVLAPNPLPARR